MAGDDEAGTVNTDAQDGFGKAFDVPEALLETR